MALNQLLKMTLKRSGAMPLDQFMQIALQHPEYGYYRTQEAIGGVDQDFTTAPEISQLFSELIALWVIEIYKMHFTTASQINLVELGPGRGTLMASILKTINTQAPQLKINLKLYFVESNATLRKIQKEIVKTNIHYIDTLSDLPLSPTILIANEFLDALPIKAFKKEKGKLKEYNVSLTSEGELCLALNPTVTPTALALNLRYSTIANDAILEYSPSIEHWIQAFATFAKQAPTYGLFIDYGYEEKERPKALTLQAIYRHRFIDLFEHIGKADLSAYVNFTALQNFATENYIKASKILTQKAFLESLHIDERLEILKKNKSIALQKHLEAQKHILCLPDEMGEHFKAITLHSPELPKAFNF